MGSRRHFLATHSVLQVIACVIILWSLSAAQDKSASASAPAPDAAKTAPQTTPAPDKGLVEGAQEQIKKLQDYVHPPEPAKDRGNPDVKVWADLHTALYYCAGSKQYGHTSKGKYMTQRDAQDNNFESALRVPCPTEPQPPAKAKSTKAGTKTASKKAPAPAPATKQPN